MSSESRRDRLTAPHFACRSPKRHYRPALPCPQGLEASPASLRIRWSFRSGDIACEATPGCGRGSGRALIKSFLSSRAGRRSGVGCGALAASPGGGCMLQGLPARKGGLKWFIASLLVPVKGAAGAGDWAFGSSEASDIRHRRPPAVVTMAWPITRVKARVSRRIGVRPKLRHASGSAAG